METILIADNGGLIVILIIVQADPTEKMIKKTKDKYINKPEKWVMHLNTNCGN